MPPPQAHDPPQAQPPPEGIFSVPPSSPRVKVAKRESVRVAPTWPDGQTAVSSAERTRWSFSNLPARRGQFYWYAGIGGVPRYSLGGS